MAGNLVSNPGFESGNFDAWTVSGNVGSDIGVDSYSGDVNSGNYGVFAGNSNTSTLSQTIPTLIGATYTVSFYLDVYQADATDGGVTATFGGHSVANLVEPTETDAFTQYSASIVATGTSSTLQFQFTDPPGYFGFDDVSVVQTAVCYVAGTRVATTRGPVAVETLQVGDLVVTATGEERPIRWLGHRFVDCRAHRDPRSVWPIRIAAHAFGEGKPERDLLVSPDHGIGVTVVDEVLMPASCLLNGSTVARVPVDTVIYWHVELDSHDILLAEGLPAESYFEMGNRSFFADGDVMDALPDQRDRGHADFCRPFVDGGPILDFTRGRLDARAREFGWRPTHDVDVHLWVDGARVGGLAAGSTLVFLIPAAAQDVRLRSDLFVSDDFNGWGDRRRLGVAVRNLAVLDIEGRHRLVPLDDARLAQGFFDLQDGPGRRWTDGDAVLDPALWDGMTGPITLHLGLDLSNVRAWHAPPQAPHATQPRAGLRLVS